MPGSIAISDLNPDTTVEGTERIPSSQNGTTKYITPQGIADYVIALIGGNTGGFPYTLPLTLS